MREKEIVWKKNASWFVQAFEYVYVYVCMYSLTFTFFFTFTNHFLLAVLSTILLHSYSPNLYFLSFFLSTQFLFFFLKSFTLSLIFLPISLRLSIFKDPSIFLPPIFLFFFIALYFSSSFCFTIFSVFSFIFFCPFMRPSLPKTLNQIPSLFITKTSTFFKQRKNKRK